MTRSAVPAIAPGTGPGIPPPRTGPGLPPPGTIRPGAAARHRRTSGYLDIPDRTLLALIALDLTMLALAVCTATLLT